MTQEIFGSYLLDLNGRGLVGRRVDDNFHYINRKQDRFSFSKRKQISGKTIKGHKWKRWVNSFVLSVTVKTPAYNPVPTINFFASGDEITNKKLASKGVGNFTSRPEIILQANKVQNSVLTSILENYEVEFFIEEIVSLLNRNNIDHNFREKVEKQGISKALKLTAYPLVEHMIFNKGRNPVDLANKSAIPRIIATVCRMRTEEQFINYFNFQNEDLKEKLSSLYVNNTLNIIQLVLLEVMNTVYTEEKILEILNIDNLETIPIKAINLQVKPEQIRGIARKMDFADFKTAIEESRNSGNNSTEFNILNNTIFPPEKESVDLWTNNYKSLRASKNKLSNFKYSSIRKYVQNHIKIDETFDEIVAPLKELRFACSTISETQITYGNFNIFQHLSLHQGGLVTWGLSKSLNSNSYLYKKFMPLTTTDAKNQRYFKSLKEVVEAVRIIDNLIFKQFSLFNVEFSYEQFKLMNEKICYLHTDNTVTRFKGIPRKSYLELALKDVDDELAFDLMLSNVPLATSKKVVYGEGTLPKSWVEDMFVTKKMRAAKPVVIDNF